MQTTSLVSPPAALPGRPAAGPDSSLARRGAIPQPSPAARVALRVAAALAPALAARALARRFLTPRRVRLEQRERDLLAKADRLAIPFAGRHPRRAEADGVVGYVWGGAGPTVLLVHGWSSAAGQLAAFVEPLRRHGFRVAAFDAPGHGASGGTSTSAFEIAEVVLAAGRLLGPLHAVVGHSAGAAAVAFAATRGLAAERLALVSPWARPQIWVERYAAAFGLSRSMTTRLVHAVEAEAGAPLHAIGLSATAPAVANPTLLVHDRDDALVEVADARAAAAKLPSGTLVETHGLGHSRILRAREAVGPVVEFLARPAEPAPAPRAVPGQRDGRGGSSASSPLRLPARGLAARHVAGAAVVLAAWATLWASFLAAVW